MIGVHAIAHVVELAWAEAIKNKPLIKRVIETNQAGYNHYAKSGKKRLTYAACCKALGEEEWEVASLHGIRWREASYRATINMIKSWRARCTDLLQEASVEVGLELQPLSAPELFIGKTFRMKTDESPRPFTLSVKKYLGFSKGQHTFEAVYHTRGRHKEKLSKENLLALMLDDSDKKEKLLVRPAAPTPIPHPSSPLPCKNPPRHAM